MATSEKLGLVIGVGGGVTPLPSFHNSRCLSLTSIYNLGLLVCLLSYLILVIWFTAFSIVNGYEKLRIAAICFCGVWAVLIAFFNCYKPTKFNNTLLMCAVGLFALIPSFVVLPYASQMQVPIVMVVSCFAMAGGGFCLLIAPIAFAFTSHDQEYESIKDSHMPI